MNQDRRKFTRLPMAEIDCEFVIESLKLAGTVSEISIEGISVSGLELIQLKYNQNATVVYSGNRFEGRCRNVLRLADGKIQVGIERSDIERLDDVERLLLAPFFKCDHYLVSCRPLGKTQDGRFVIKLFDGNKFATGRENIVSLTVSERMAQLDKSTADLAARIYGVERRDLIDYEFGDSFPATKQSQS